SNKNLSESKDIKSSKDIIQIVNKHLASCFKQIPKNDLNIEIENTLRNLEKEFGPFTKYAANIIQNWEMLEEINIFNAIEKSNFDIFYSLEPELVNYDIAYNKVKTKNGKTLLDLAYLKLEQVLKNYKENKETKENKENERNEGNERNKGNEENKINKEENLKNALDILLTLEQ